ncbi:OB-fold protein [Formosa maritima]|uniref:tRNA_anti-like n=1 Tax=Formosa maritima TaxID=2592046 RepID=A0A5D0GEA6_9FLAO|nr:hypothetical protein [Formosa maritima]TYA57308.1 hypothetical protein FVF61_05230 [Formosa maritima]
MRKKIIILFFIIIAFVAYKYVFQNHRDIQSESASFIMSTHELSKEFQINPNDSQLKYLDKTIQITGVISELNNLSMTLDETVYCLFLESLDSTLILNKKVIIKGRFIGYDDLLEQIKLDQCNIIN